MSAAKISVHSKCNRTKHTKRRSKFLICRNQKFRSPFRTVSFAVWMHSECAFIFAAHAYFQKENAQITERNYRIFVLSAKSENICLYFNHNWMIILASFQQSLLWLKKAAEKIRGKFCLWNWKFTFHLCCKMCAEIVRTLSEVFENFLEFRSRR